MSLSHHAKFGYVDGFVIRHYDLPGIDYSLNDDELRAVPAIMETEVGMEKLFYNQTVHTFEQFRYFFERDGNFCPVAFAFKDGLLHGVCWLTNVEAKTARLHFFCSKAARVTLNTVNVGKAVLKHWARIKDEHGEPLLQSLVGITPASYKLVIKYIQRVGFTVLGTAKGGVHLMHEGRYDDAVISTMELKEEY